MALKLFRAAPLPAPPLEWDAQYMRQFIRVLEIYFSQLDSNTPNYAQSYTADDFYGSGVGIHVPYNQFYSLADQSTAAVDLSAAVQLENTSFTNGISIAGTNDTEITFSEPGIYKVTYSLSFKNTTNEHQDIDIWYRYNDGVTTTDIANSNSKFTIPARKATGDPSYLIAVTAYTIEVANAGDFVELVWAATSTSVTLEHLPAKTYSAGVNPAIPATPSAIVQADFVSKAV